MSAAHNLHVRRSTAFAGPDTLKQWSVSKWTKWIVHKHSCHIRVGKAYKKSGPTVGAEERGEERAAT